MAVYFHFGSLNEKLDNVAFPTIFASPLVWYHTPYIELTYQEEDVDYEMMRKWEDSGRNYGSQSLSLNQMVQVLTSPTFYSMQYHHVFFTTWATFTTANELFKKLLERFNMPFPGTWNMDEFEVWRIDTLSKIRLRIVTCIKYWIETYFEEDFQDLTELDKVIHHIRLINGGPKFAFTLEYAVCKAKMERKPNRTPVSIQDPPPKSIGIMPSIKSLFNVTKKKFVDSILNYPTPSIAQTLCIIDNENFCGISRNEWLNGNSQKGSREISAPYINRMVVFFNCMVNWIGNCVLSETDLGQRLFVIEKLIEIGEICLQNNNLHGVFIITSGLSLAPIYRLKNTWSQLTTEWKTRFEGINRIASRDGSFRAMRQAYRNAKPPCVPYIGMYLTDVTFIEDGNQKYTHGKVNIDKLAALTNLILEVQMRQHDQYTFPKDDDLYNILLKLGGTFNSVDEEQMYQKSLEIEPRNKK
jgi:son of sevenless-like protein